MFFVQLIMAVGFSSIFPFLPLYVEDLGSTTGLSIELLAGLVFSGQAFTMMITSPIWGTLSDRFGRKLMVERSLFGGAVIVFLMAYVHSAEQLVLLRVVQGMITGTVAATNALIASVAPRERTGYAMGVIQTGLGTGVALGPVLGGAIADMFGYAAAFYVTGALLFLAGLLVVFFVHEDFRLPETLTNHRIGFMAEWRLILKTSGVRIAYALRFISQLGRMLITPIAPFFIATLLPNPDRVNTVTGLVVGISAATTTLSAIFLGRLGDRIGHRRILIACYTFAALLYFPQSIVTTSMQLLILQAFVGIALGGIIPSISALLARSTAEGGEGAAYGLDNSINASGRAIAPLIGSAVSLAFGLRAVFLATGSLFILAAAFASIRAPVNDKTTHEIPLM
jgi:DHA1 family multidrug resistance protein-like MFS transporter